MLRVDGDSLLQPIEGAVDVAARVGHAGEVSVRHAGERVAQREGALEVNLGLVEGARFVEGHAQVEVRGRVVAEARENGAALVDALAVQ